MARIEWERYAKSDAIQRMGVEVLKDRQPTTRKWNAGRRAAARS